MESSRCRALITAVETGSITAAAEKLGYTPSGVSQLIAALEKDFGFTLIHRSRKGVQPTDMGERMLPSLREFVKAEDRIYQHVDEVNGLVTGSVTIGSYPSISSHWLPAVIREFQENYPAIEIHLLEGIRQEICTWLDTQQADIAFMTWMGNDDYHWELLAVDRMLAVLPRDHACAALDSYPLRECERENFIMPAMGHDVDVEKLLEDNGLHPPIRFSTLENFSAISLIEKGLGISIMNELCTRSWQRDVVKMPLDPPQFAQFGLALRSLRNASPAVRKFVEFAVARLKQE